MPEHIRISLAALDLAKGFDLFAALFGFIVLLSVLMQPTMAFDRVPFG